MDLSPLVLTLKIALLATAFSVVLGIGAVVTVGAIVAAMALAALHPRLLLKIIAPIEHVIDKVLALSLIHI